jgi:hypothetical protein
MSSIADQSRGSLKIVVVGAGLVGLSVAAILRRQGHRVEVLNFPSYFFSASEFVFLIILPSQVYESSKFHHQIGAGIGLGSNLTRILGTMIPDLKWENVKTVNYDFVSLGSSCH